MSPSTLAGSLTRISGGVMRYGLVGMLLWFGAFKFTATEAMAIEPLLSESPFLSWLPSAAGSRGASRTIGSAEIAIAALLALRPISPRLASLGSLAAAGMFLTTLSFLFTTPGLWVRAEGFVVPTEGGAFLLKDVFLLAAALWSAGEAMEARQGGSAPSRRR
jgi:uncharacterized membrane protein YkgB